MFLYTNVVIKIGRDLLFICELRIFKAYVRRSQLFLAYQLDEMPKEYVDFHRGFMPLAMSDLYNNSPPTHIVMQSY